MCKRSIEWNRKRGDERQMFPAEEIIFEIQSYGISGKGNGGLGGP